jgi:hypothetical protein
MRATYEAPRGGLTVTLERLELAAVEGAAAHAVTVWLKGVPRPFRVALPDADVRRVLALWCAQALDGGGELRVAD